MIEVAEKFNAERLVEPSWKSDCEIHGRPIPSRIDGPIIRVINRNHFLDRTQIY